METTKKMSILAKRTIMGWLANIEDGDTIKFQNGDFVIYNDGGCELDRVAIDEQE